MILKGLLFGFCDELVQMKFEVSPHLIIFFKFKKSIHYSKLCCTNSQGNFVIFPVIKNIISGRCIWIRRLVGTRSRRTRALLRTARPQDFQVRNLMSFKSDHRFQCSRYRYDPDMKLQNAFKGIYNALTQNKKNVVRIAFGFLFDI